MRAAIFTFALFLPTLAIPLDRSAPEPRAHFASVAIGACSVLPSP